MKVFNRFFLSLLLLTFILSGFSCISQASYFNKGNIDRKNGKIVVLPFKDYNHNEGNNSGELVRNIFETTLMKRGFNLVEIEKTSMAGLHFDYNKELIPEWFNQTGSAIGADFIIYGSVHDYRTYQSTTSFLYLFSWLEITSSVGVTARLVSCKTGEVIWTGAITRASYTFNDAASEAVKDLIKTIRIRPVDLP